MNCFFCCKILPKEEPCQLNNNEENLGNSDILDTKISDNSNESNLNEGVDQKNILLISHYLKLPRSEIIKAKELGAFSVIRLCQDCHNISGKLGKLCGLLEITQMKVNYYLNLLTYKISQKDEQVDRQEINLSSFQETFHKKCSAKSAEIDPNPKLQLIKCNLRPPPEQDNPLETKDYEDMNVILEITEDPPVIPDQSHQSTEGNGVKYSCEYCPATFSNIANKRRHIDGSHLIKKDLRRNLIKSCEFCGTVMSSSNLSKHKRKFHGIDGPLSQKFIRCVCGKILKRRNMKCHKMVCKKYNEYRCQNSTISCYVKFECSNCKQRFSRRPNMDYHVRYVCTTGKVITLEKGTKELNYHCKTSKCEYCGTIVFSKNLKRHVNQVHSKFDFGLKVYKYCEYCKLAIRNSVHERAHMLEAHKVEITDRGFRCNECNTLYTVRSNWRRHLSKSEECRLAANLGEMPNRNENKETLVKQEGVEISITNDDQTCIVNDPLANL